MNKIIALFVALAVFSSAALFAAPVSGAPGAAPASQTGESFDLDALFADVDAPQLSDTEAETIEGEGWFNALISGIIGAVVGGATGAAFGGGVSLGVLTIPGWIAGAIAGGASSAFAAYPTDNIVIKGSVTFK
ncbi:MAG: hypothetical protein LBG43_04685 [Treponema sp.]|nr:hypothetical protein [Treponema sp.]